MHLCVIKQMFYSINKCNAPYNNNNCLCAFEFSRTLSPGMSLNFQMKFTPVRTGAKKFIVKFTSREVKEVDAEKIILIT